MIFFDWIKNFLKRTFFKRKNLNVEVKYLTPTLEKAKQEPIIVENQASQIQVSPAHREALQADIPIPKDVFQSIRVDLNKHQPFMPNWGELDPTVSTISNGHIKKELINFLYDEFALRYGKLTTDLGYGLIYSIVVNAIENEDRSVSSALREAIARSNDSLLCVAVVKDYCFRKSIHFDKYERITLDILKRREAYYSPKSNETNLGLPINSAETFELSRSSWLFNGVVTTIESLFLIVKIPTLKGSRMIRDFNKQRKWKLNQNVVVQWDGGEDYRILDFRI